jgi:hypothetical protein
MRVASPSLRRRLKEAAILRAAGASWAAVAAKLHRAVATCNHWPSRYRASWKEIYEKACDGVLAELTAESRATLRTHLREKLIRDQREAAKLLLAHADRNQPGNDRRRRDDPTQELIRGLSREKAREVKSAADDALGTESAG